MVVTRYMGGKEITQDDLRKINLSDNPQIRELIDRVVARVNASVEAENTNQEGVSANDIPA
jgi:hypothetical protein